MSQHKHNKPCAQHRHSDLWWPSKAHQLITVTDRNSQLLVIKSELRLTKSELRGIAIVTERLCSQNCEFLTIIRLFFYFLISGGNGLLLPNARIKYNFTHQTFPQPLTKRSCKTLLCMCESCQAIFHNNILYREIAHSRKGTSYARALRMSAVRYFCFH